MFKSIDKGKRCMNRCAKYEVTSTSIVDVNVNIRGGISVGGCKGSAQQ